LQVYGVIMAGWASNSKYAFLAALRSAAQMVSYEVSIGFVIITVLLCAGSLNLGDIVEAQNSRFGLLGWYWLPLFPMFVVFFISALAETNRPPFDLLEAESELVAGFMVEYSSTPYMLFMLGEYVAVVLMCALGTVLWRGGDVTIIDGAAVNGSARLVGWIASVARATASVFRARTTPSWASASTAFAWKTSRGAASPAATVFSANRTCACATCRACWATCSRSCEVNIWKKDWRVWKATCRITAAKSKFAGAFLESASRYFFGKM
jgi:formate hydrogenlyase subunit 4